MTNQGKEDEVLRWEQGDVSTLIADSELKTWLRESMVKRLIERECTVVFTKVNGDLREMVCTLNPDAIPEAPNLDAAIKARAINDDVIPVWDVNAAGWRSFRVDSTLSFT